MRKEVRIGAAIGGVLIAVVTVGVVVNSRNNKKDSNAVTLDTGKPDDGGGTDRSSPPDSGPAATGDHNDPSGSQPPTSPQSDSTPPTTGGSDIIPHMTANRPEEPSIPNTPIADTGTSKSTANWGAILAADHVDESMLPHSKPEASREPLPPDLGAAGNVVDTSDVHLIDDQPHTTNHAGNESGTSTNRVAATRSYTIQSGDTFSSIARVMYGDGKYYKELMKANPKVDPSRLKLGTSITLPDKSQFKHASMSTAVTPFDSTRTTAGANKPSSSQVNSAREYRVQSNDSLYKISMKLYRTPNRVDSIYQLNKDKIGSDPAKLKLNDVLKLRTSGNNRLAIIFGV